ncbi:hypothetical protein B296_00029852 [Ensete ventricosum]|uniref:Uncharacterized protein n=1 Tax=Ensete ventricosum TaxID=4639 RepID=A0A426YCJ3_ENSVE|nr:hypothetical protein B296_00029852 [Ensete ventricosum]
MNHCDIQQNAFAACEEMRVPFAFVDRKAHIFCPRLRQFSPLAAVVDPLRPVCWQSSHQSDFFDSIVGADRSFAGGIRLRRRMVPSIEKVEVPQQQMGRIVSQVVRHQSYNKPIGIPGLSIILAKVGSTSDSVQLKNIVT